WSSSKVVSPMTIVLAPAFIKAAYDASPMGGVIFTPATVTLRSLRGTASLNTPSFSLSAPFTPVSCSILAVSSFPSAARLGDTAPARAKYANAANAAMAEEHTIFVQKFFSILNSFHLFLLRLVAFYFQIIEGGNAIRFCPLTDLARPEMRGTMIKQMLAVVV